MRISYITLAVFAGLTLMSCDRREPAARQAGREAHQASEELKHGAKQAAHELRNAGKEFRQGWNERRAETTHEPPPRRR